MVVTVNSRGERIGARGGEAWTDAKRGVTVRVSKGSAPVPLWALTLVAKAVEATVRAPASRTVVLRWTKGSGGGRYYAYRGAPLGTLSVKAAGMGRGLETYILLHELAHMADAWRGTRWTHWDSKPHGDGFHDALHDLARLTATLRLVRGYHTPKVRLTRAARRWRERSAAPAERRTA